MLIRFFIAVIATFFIADSSLANTIKTFSYNTVFVSNTQVYAQGKVNALSSSSGIYRGNIVYVRVKQSRGPNGHFRFDDVGGNWMPSAIPRSDFYHGQIQEEIIQNLDSNFRDSFFITVHGGAMGFDIIGGQIAIPWVCQACRVIITDIPDVVLP